MLSQFRYNFIFKPLVFLQPDIISRRRVGKNRVFWKVFFKISDCFCNCALSPIAEVIVNGVGANEHNQF